MATKKQKRERGIAKRQAFEAETRENGLAFLRLAQAGRAAERAKAEEARKQRAITKSKRLAKTHQREKQGVASYKPLPEAARKSIIKKEN